MKIALMVIFLAELAFVAAVVVVLFRETLSLLLKAAAGRKKHVGR